MEVANYNIITLKNIDNEDFTFEYDSSTGNPPYMIPAGQIKRFPSFLAEHALKHLIDKILTKQNKKTNNQEARQALASLIVIEEENFQSPAQLTPAQQQAKEVESLNKPSDLEGILQRNKDRLKGEEPTARPAVTPTTEDVPTEEEKFEGLEPGEEPIKGDELDTTEPVGQEPPVKVKAVPTRGEIYKYAEKQGMVLGEKELKVYDRMNIPELLKELGDPREALV